MFAKYDLSYFPYIFIDFDRNLQNDNDFYTFTNEWLNLYNYKKPFILIFNTIHVQHVSVKYCFYMSAFIKKIRNMPIQYLQKSYIIVKSKNIMNLLDIIFYLQPPVADVFICDTIIEKKENACDNIKINHTIPAKNPFLAFL